MSSGSAKRWGDLTVPIPMADRSPSARTLSFSRIEVENWRNFKSASAELTRRFFIVGPNASGKSNFLDVFRFLRDIVSIGGGLQEAVRQRGGVSSLRSLAARRYSDIQIITTVGVEDSAAVWEYSLRLTQDNQRRTQIREEYVKHRGRELFHRPDPADLKDQERLTQTYLEQVNVNKDYRELVDFFASVKYLHIVPQLVRDPQRSVGRKNDPFGGDFLEQVALTNEKVKNARLRRIQEALKIAVPQLRELELVRDDRGVPHLRGNYVHWRSRGAWQTEEQFSDGTLRLVGLLWALQDGTGPLLLEEPELSLHPEVIRFIPQLFSRVQRHSGKQVIVSTQSPELLSDDGIGLNEVALLIPEKEGTKVRSALTIREAETLLKSGLTIADVVLPRTGPRDVSQLSLLEFGV